MSNPNSLSGTTWRNSGRLFEIQNLVFTGVLMSFLDWVSAAAALTVVLGFLGTIIGWVFKRYADQLVNRLVKDYLSELKPNGGGSMRDDVRELRREVTEIKVEMGHLQGRFAQHLAEGDYETW